MAELETEETNPTTNNIDNNNLADDQSVSSFNSLSSSSSSTIKQPLSDLVASLAIGPDPDSDRPQRGVASELYVWGDNECGCLGIPPSPINGFQRNKKLENIGVNGDVIFSPQTIPMGVMAEKVKSISCSEHHTLVASTLGAVYSCGDGSDGQLGHGVMKSVLRLTLISTFASMIPPPVITLVSAGSHTSGSHSAAVDADGKLYTWGKSSACGHIGSAGSLSSYANSTVPFTSMFRSDINSPTGPVVFPRIVRAFKRRPVLKISCGGGFTLAIACLPSKTNIDNTKTAVYAWGLWAGGR